MTSQNWIYDPPPPPPPKKTVSENMKMHNSQRPMNARGSFQGNTRGNTNQRPHLGNGRTNNRPQQRGQNSTMASTFGYQQPHTANPSAGYQPTQVPPMPIFQPPLGYAPENFPYQYPIQQQYHPYPPQPLPQSQQSIPFQSHTYPPRPLPVYQTSQNVYGYTLSSTAYSLPSHHYKPQASERPDLSEEELRYALEQQMKIIKPG